MTENYKKKLIEVALPLAEINSESSREKSLRHGHPSTMHLWWARRPLATCRAVLFATLIDDPSSNPEKFPTEELQRLERERLFEIIKKLVVWENSNDKVILDEAYNEIVKSVGNDLPAVLDPFCGGGSIPLEAQRLGLEAHGSDLNPVAVLLNKALIEIPPRFYDLPPVNPDDNVTLKQHSYSGLDGLVKDIEYYGNWVYKEAKKKIGEFYPEIEVAEGTNVKAGTKVKAVAYLWARTIKCPNPVCGFQIPLLTTFNLSKKYNKAIKPKINNEKKIIEFDVIDGFADGDKGTQQARGKNFACLACKQAASESYLGDEFKNKRNGSQMVAIVAIGAKNKIYLPVNEEQIKVANLAIPAWKPEAEMNQESPKLLGSYKIRYWHELFTQRQLLALTTFSDLIQNVKEIIISDALKTQMKTDNIALANGGKCAQAYAEAIVTYLTLVLGKLADYNSSFCSWHNSKDLMRNTFSKQAIPMIWDFAEANPYSEATGSFISMLDWVIKSVAALPKAKFQGSAYQQDATKLTNEKKFIISTDPPYYDNICYSDLSDYFYIWLRKCLLNTYPDLFKTMLVPKTDELVAFAYRHDKSKSKAKDFFEHGLNSFFTSAKQAHDSRFPLIIYYAFKQTENKTKGTDDNNRSSTGWQTILQALIDSGFSITGTWPMRTELTNRTNSINTNALASSIILVCRPKLANATRATKREFLNELKNELPLALKLLKQGNIAPVDMAQAAIGPGIAIFSRYCEVIETDGTKMDVGSALEAINKILDEVLSEEDNNYDLQTKLAIAWFEQFGFSESTFGQAETLSKAKDVSIESLVESKILRSQAGKVNLLKPTDLPDFEARFSTVWFLTHSLIKALQTTGNTGAAKILSQVPEKANLAYDLSYRLYNICEVKKWATDAQAYNDLITAWLEIQKLANQKPESNQTRLTFV